MTADCESVEAVWSLEFRSLIAACLLLVEGRTSSRLIAIKFQIREASDAGRSDFNFRLFFVSLSRLYRLKLINLSLYPHT
jgi:hypothetical protein